LVGIAFDQRDMAGAVPQQINGQQCPAKAAAYDGDMVGYEHRSSISNESVSIA
jgi:hypothetical protein